MKIKTFPITVHENWLEEVGKAVKVSGVESKHEYIIRAVNEKVAKDLEKSNK